jgi:hypothetical protein
MDSSVLVASVHCNDMVELAPQVGALMVAVEHRYYGESMPTGRELSTEKLRWLSSQQALGDLAAFHSQIVANYSLTNANKWVSFGGSYPGMMAGFFRLKVMQRPELDCLVFTNFSSAIHIFHILLNRTRTNTNPHDTKAIAVGRSGCACGAQKVKA